MFRFLTTLVLTGVSLLAASAWWSSRDPGDPWPELPGATGTTAAPPAGNEAPDRPMAPPATGDAPGEPVASSAVREPAAKPASAARRAGETTAPKVAPPAIPAPAVSVPEPTRRALPPIPAPEIQIAERTRTLAPSPEPMLRTGGALDAEGSGSAWDDESKVAFDDGLEVGETVIYEDQEIDELWAETFPENAVPSEADEGAPAEQSLAMNGDEGADLIRRLLDVYESLGRRR